ncbi:hypothetical protein CORC01_13885 [Colletotrichum orchidophilum]|uniref:Uncharacterized protein n=1 Tax=Colletotrichum orchidophilum TaxID=1209926 RepID=A0A1G4ANX1_9PEZI|nr:uncharacterized protein CORC01_13885 [Colletotrichum orchidophilum]OHE90811.1 hypothetical protein CORC01_13885 [Colletotrichum orchidophilum]
MCFLIFNGLKSSSPMMRWDALCATPSQPCCMYTSCCLMEKRLSTTPSCRLGTLRGGLLATIQSAGQATLILCV